MSAWSNLRDQERVIALLRRAIVDDRVHHAYLFTGAGAATSRALALAFAAAVNCLRAPGQGCDLENAADACDSCAKISTGIHPDIITLEREGAAQIIPIENVRNQIIARVAMPPHEARMRCFIIDEAAALAGPAANALLKTLEEPPARTMFLLATMAPDQLLPTIRSRCQRVMLTGIGANWHNDDTHLDGVDERNASDVANANALRELAIALANFDGAKKNASATDLAGRIAEQKGQAAVVLSMALARLHSEARRDVAAGRLAAARSRSLRATRLQSWQGAITFHNTHAQLALTALLHEWSTNPDTALSGAANEVR